MTVATAGYTIQIPRETAAGARKQAATAYFRHADAPSAARGAPAAGGSAVMLAPPLNVLLVRGLGGLLELRGDAADVVRALQEVLEELPLALADGPAEGGRL